MIGATPDNKRLYRKASLFISSRRFSDNYLECLQHATTPTLDSFVNDDPEKEKTFGRKIVEKYLYKLKWYNPNGYEQAHRKPSGNNKEFSTFEDFEKPSILRSWAFFEHYTLARHKKIPSSRSYRMRTPPGSPENNTCLYSVWLTRIMDLDSWGIGIVLYFSMLMASSILLIVIGIINIPNIVYFGLGEYSQGKSGGHTKMNFISRFASGTAICTERDWVICRDCDLELWKKAHDGDSTIEAFGLNFVQKNNCIGVNSFNGRISFASLILVIIGFFIIAYRQYKTAILAEEGKASSRNYTVCVENPPPDAVDPLEWRKFFTKFDKYEPPLVTIALNNRPLICALKDLRLLTLKLETKRKDQLQEHKGLKAFFKMIRNPMSEEKILSKIKEVRAKIAILQQEKYDVGKVYVTMETEAGQLNAINILSAGKLAIRKNPNKSPVPLFREKMLNITTALEPSQIEWIDLSIKLRQQLFARVISFIVVITIIVLEFIIFRAIREAWGLVATVVFVRLFNAFTPRLAMALVTNFEFHRDDETKQISILTKMIFFLWVTTTFIWANITPFTKVLQDGQKDFIPTLFIFLAVESALPLIKALDMKSTFAKHFKAPKATTQQEMNSFFRGTQFRIGERYADMMKIMFASFVFSAIWPASFLAGGTALAVQFWADKYSLLRVWSAAPDVGDRLDTANFFFVGVTITIFTVFSHWYWFGFPFDNLCIDEEVPLTELLNGSLSEFFQESENMLVQTYKYCDQKFKWKKYELITSFDDFEWMTNEQQEVVKFFNWAVLAVSIGFIILVVGYFIYILTISQLRGHRKPATRDQKMDFSSLYSSTSILAYIPQVRIPGFDYNCFVCDIDGLDEDMIGWRDFKRSYDHYNLIFDVPYEGMKREGAYGEYERKEGSSGTSSIANDTSPPIFSIVKHWPRFPSNSNPTQD